MLQSRRYHEASFSTNQKSKKPLEPSEWRDVYAQAEKLFSNGEYELALVWYHRGHRLRPKAKEFINGINKCEQAISNNTELLPNISESQSVVSHSPTDVNSVRTYGKNTEKSSKSRHSHKTKASTNTQTSHTKRRLDSDVVKDVQHIMDLNKDRTFLKGLLKQIDGEQLGSQKKNKGKRAQSQTNSAKSKSTMAVVVERGVEYLDTRSIFWEQQMPLHIIRQNMDPYRLRESAPVVEERAEAGDSFRKGYANLLGEIMLCNEEFLKGEYEQCFDRTKKCIKLLRKYKSSEVSNKYEILGSLYSVMGNAFFEMELYKEALDSYVKDLDIANDKDLLQSKSRALENMGRVYARVGEFDTAIRVWQEKLDMQEEDTQEAWLYHEIGYCYLSKREFIMAKQYAEVALSLAKDRADVRWQLNSCLLIAQALAKLREYYKARHYFKKARGFSRDLEDEPLTETIEGALEDVSRAIRFSRAEHSDETKKPSTVFEQTETEPEVGGSGSSDNKQESPSTVNENGTQSPHKPRRVESRLSVDRSVISFKPHEPSEYSDTQTVRSFSTNMGTDGASAKKARQKRVKIMDDFSNGDSMELLDRADEGDGLHKSIHSKSKGESVGGGSQNVSLQSSSAEKMVPAPAAEEAANKMHPGYIAPARRGKFAKLTLAEIRKEFEASMNEKREQLKNNPPKSDAAPQIYFNKTKQRPEKTKDEPKKAPEESPSKEAKNDTPKQVEAKKDTAAPPPPPQPVITAEEKEELEKDKDLREALQSFDEAVSSKQQQDHKQQSWQPKTRLDVNKFPWRNTENKKTPKPISFLSRSTTKHIRRRAKQPSSDDEDSDEEYNEIVEAKKRGSPRLLKKSPDYTASDVVNTPYGTIIADFKNQRTNSFVGHQYTSMNSLPIEQESPFVKAVEREDSFTKGSGTARENSFMHREGSFVKAMPMKRERSFTKGPTIQREGSFVKSSTVQREGSFGKSVKGERSFVKSPTGKPPKSPSRESIYARRKERTFYDQTESGTTIRSLEAIGPQNNIKTENTYSQGIQSEYHYLNNRKLQSQRDAGLSQSLPALQPGRKSPHKRSLTTLVGDHTDLNPSSKTRLPVLPPKSGKTNRTSDSTHSKQSDKTERLQKPHPKNEGGKSGRRAKERGNAKDMEILKMLLDMKN